jgi:Hydroquinone 1,2-dioxygenase large subunit N-terminal
MGDMNFKAVLSSTQPQVEVMTSEADKTTCYRSFKLGGFEFQRDEYFARISWPAKGQRVSHVMPVDAFLRAMMRDVAWGFFYGWVNFDHVVGTRNLYGKVELYGGRYYGPMKSAGLDHTETFESPAIMATFKAILGDWVNAGFDPFAAPEETGKTVYGPKNGDNLAAIDRYRVPTKRMPGLQGDSPLRSDANGFPVNRQFTDVPQDEPEVKAEPGFEKELHAFNLFKYLSRSDVTWNPSVTAVCNASLACPTTEEYILPIVHGNDRVEWFVQMSDEITWEVQDKETGALRARITMKAGDVAAMPADIRHQGFSPKRSMLFVWENATPGLPKLYESGKLKPYPVEF